MFIINMYASICGFLLGVLASILRRELSWNLFTSVSPTSRTTVPSGSLQTDLKRLEALRAFSGADASSPDISASIHSSSFAVTVYGARQAGAAADLTVVAVAWAVACVSALACVSVGAHLVAAAAAKRFVLSRFMRPLLSELSQLRHDGGPSLPRGLLSPYDHVRIDALLSSQLNVLDTLQSDIQQRLGAAGDAEGSWLAWSALLLLLREMRATMALVRSRFRRARRRRPPAAAAAPATATNAAGQPQTDNASREVPSSEDAAQQWESRGDAGRRPSPAEERASASEAAVEADASPVRPRPRPRLRSVAPRARRPDAPSRVQSLRAARGVSLQLRMLPASLARRAFRAEAAQR